MPAPHVYVHVPFCGRRCAYCDFAITVRADTPVDAYVAGVSAELELRFPRADHAPWAAETLYFGGGTPSRLGGAGVAQLMETIRDRIELLPDAEVTLEANPEDVTREAAIAWSDAGINRLSIGSQSFDDSVLRWMHRTHDADAIHRAVAHARDAGITNLSLDLIFALPDEIERDWERDVAMAVALEPAHLSLYGLTVEPFTPLGRWRDRGLVTDTPDERYEREFLHAHAALTAAGFEHYEVSNYGAPGFHARHNSAYWTGDAYAGLGPSAHEFGGAERRWNVRSYADWLRRVNAATDPREDHEVLTAANVAAEAVYLGLRSRAGLPLHGAEFSYVAPWLEAGWGAIHDNTCLTLTPSGWLRLDALAAALTAFRSRL
jgi:oxygen-independent coproporphyrinogen-3 oxidase